MNGPILILGIWIVVLTFSILALCSQVATATFHTNHRERDTIDGNGLTSFRKTRRHLNLVVVFLLALGGAGYWYFFLNNPAEPIAESHLEAAKQAGKKTVEMDKPIDVDFKQE